MSTGLLTMANGDRPRVTDDVPAQATELGTQCSITSAGPLVSAANHDRAKHTT